MLSKLTSNQKILLILFALVLLIGTSICVASVLFFAPSSTTEEPTPEAYLTIQYCGSNPKELCLLNFGRDSYGNAIINVFIPNDEFPEFYLRIIRTTDEVIYVCVKNEGSANIVCKGDALLLGERVEIYITSTESHQIIAQGIFLIKAIYISPQEDDVNKPPQTKVPTVLPTSTPTSAETPVKDGTPTPTPEVSYPSYP
jgi:hypothetical protein